MGESQRTNGTEMEKATIDGGGGMSMKERPILFSGEMVRAILEGRKTQTRRVIKPQPKGKTDREWIDYLMPKPFEIGMRLWLRETWRPWNDPDLYLDCVQYRADMGIIKPKISDENIGNKFHEECEETISDQVDGISSPWHPSIHMPKWASRITLEITNVRVERIQNISEDDAWKEGFPDPEGTNREYQDRASYWFKNLWDSINSKKGFGWDKNPWVWAIEFKRLEPDTEK